MGILSIAGLSFIIISLFGYFRNRKARDSARTKLRSAPQGFVEVEGLVKPLDKTFKNSSQEDCVYYSLRIEKLNPFTGKRKSVFSEISVTSFLLVDETGAVEVHPSAQSRVEKDLSWNSLSLLKFHPVFGLFRLIFLLGLLPMRTLLNLVPWQDIKNDLRGWRSGEQVVIDGMKRRGWLSFSIEQRKWLSAKLASHHIQIPALWSLFNPGLLFLRVTEQSMPAQNPVYVNGFFESSSSTATDEALAVSVVGTIRRNQDHPLIIINQFEEQFLKSLGLRHKKQFVLGSVFLFGSLIFSTGFKQLSRKNQQQIPAAIALNFESQKAPVQLWSLEIDRNLSLFLDAKTRETHFAVTPSLINNATTLQKNPRDIQRPVKNSLFVGATNDSRGKSAVDVWDVKKKRRLNRFWVSGILTVLPFFTDSNSYAVVLKRINHEKQALQLWSVETGLKSVEYELQNPRITPVLHSSPSGRWVTLAQSAGFSQAGPALNVYLLDSEKRNLAEMPQIKLQKTNEVTNIIFSEEKNLMAVGLRDHIYIYSLPDFKLVSEFSQPDSHMFPLLYVPGTDQIVTEINRTTVAAIDPLSRTVKKEITVLGPRDRGGVTYSVSDNHRWLVFTNEEGIWRWDLANLNTTPSKLLEFSWYEKPKPGDSRLFVNISDDGQWFTFKSNLLSVNSTQRIPLPVPRIDLTRLPATSKPADCLTFDSACWEASLTYEKQDHILGELAWLQGACEGGLLHACQKLISKKEVFKLTDTQVTRFQNLICLRETESFCPPSQ